MFRRVKTHTDEEGRAAGESSGAGTGPPKEKVLQQLAVVGPILRLYRGYSRRNGPLLAAGIAYYGLFAATPLFLVTLQVAGLIVGTTTAQQELSEAMQDFLGPYMADLLSSIVVQMGGSWSTTFVTTGIALVVYASVRLFIRIQVSFNIMWDVRVFRRGFSKRRIFSRLATFALILVPTALFLAALFLNAGISWLEGLAGTSGPLLTLVQAVIPFLIIWLAMMIIYAVLPDIRLSWRDTWLGALCASACIAIGTWAFGTYLTWSGGQKYAGSIGAVLALIVWVDFMAIIVLLGVRLNKAICVWRGRLPEPYEYAGYITETPDEADTAEMWRAPLAEEAGLRSHAPSGTTPALDKASDSAAADPAEGAIANEAAGEASETKGDASADA